LYRFSPFSLDSLHTVISSSSSARPSVYLLPVNRSLLCLYSALRDVFLLGDLVFSFFRLAHLCCLSVIYG
jgi:hypothetical protein